jgi:hypothetical protein
LAGDVKRWRELILEEYFTLQMHLGMSLSDLGRLPVRYRKWYLDRLKTYFDRSSDSVEAKPASSNIAALNKFEESIQKKSLK